MLTDAAMQDFLYKNAGPAAIALMFSFVMLRWFMGRIEKQDQAKDKYQEEMVSLLTNVISKNTAAMEGVQNTLSNLANAVQTTGAANTVQTQNLVQQIQNLSQRNSH